MIPPLTLDDQPAVPDDLVNVLVVPTPVAVSVEFGVIVQETIDEAVVRPAVFEQENLSSSVRQGFRRFFPFLLLRLLIGPVIPFLPLTLLSFLLLLHHRFDVHPRAPLPGLSDQLAQPFQESHRVRHAANPHGLNDRVEPTLGPGDQSPLGRVAHHEPDVPSELGNVLRVFLHAVKLFPGLVDHDLAQVVEHETLDAPGPRRPDRVEVVVLQVPTGARADLQHVPDGLSAQVPAPPPQEHEAFGKVDLVVKVAGEVHPAGRNVGVLGQVQHLGFRHRPSIGRVHVHQVRGEHEPDTAYRVKVHVERPAGAAGREAGARGRRRRRRRGRDVVVVVDIV